jgi:hypothetical protein
LKRLRRNLLALPTFERSKTMSGRWNTAYNGWKSYPSAFDSFVRFTPG